MTQRVTYCLELGDPGVSTSRKSVYMSKSDGKFSRARRILRCQSRSGANRRGAYYATTLQNFVAHEKAGLRSDGRRPGKQAPFEKKHTESFRPLAASVIMCTSSDDRLGSSRPLMVNHRLPSAVVAANSIPPTDPLRFLLGDLPRRRGVGDPLLVVFLGATTTSFTRFGFDGGVRNGRSGSRRSGATG